MTIQNQWKKQGKVSEKFLLKEQCYEIFDFRFFSWISLPHAPEYPISAVSNFFEKFVKIFTAQGASPVSLMPMAIWHRCRWHQRYQWQNLLPVSSIPMVHLDLQISPLVTHAKLFGRTILLSYITLWIFSRGNRCGNTWLARQSGFAP